MHHCCSQVREFMHMHPGGMAGKAAPAHSLSLVFAEDLYQEYGDGVVLQKW